jgi:prepilin-type N-terminal cleavage/methylation domain-containing protein
MMPSVSLSNRKSPARSAEAGYSLPELLIVVGIIVVVLAMSTMVVPAAVAFARANSGAAELVAALRLAREQSIAQRRNVQVTFTAPNRITVSRVDVPGPGTTVLSNAWLEGGNTFRLVSGLPDTPDAFGNGTAVSFGTATTLAFTSDGGFVDQNGDPANGTVFMANGSAKLSARAVTIFGPTALIREWRWNGARWTN